MTVLQNYKRRAGTLRSFLIDFSYIMKKNTQLAEILSFYTLEKISALPISKLKQQLNDVRRLYAFAELGVPQSFAKLRKKVNRINQTVKQVEKQAVAMELDFSKRLTSNYRLAYSILSMSAPPLFPSKKKFSLLQELKLKFLQSQNVTLQDWHAFVRVQKKVLVISVDQRNAQVVVGLEQKEKSTNIDWLIVEASIRGQKSPQFLVFFHAFWEWSQQHRKKSSLNLINDIKRLLCNFSAIVLYLQLKRAFKNTQLDQVIKYTKNKANEKIVDFQWKFNFFQSISSPKFVLSIDRKEILKISFKANAIDVALNWPALGQRSQQLILYAKAEKTQSFHHYVHLPQLLQNFQKRLHQCYNRHEKLFDDHCNIVVSAAGLDLLPKKLQQSGVKKMKSQGVWIYLQIEEGTLFYVQENGTLSSENRQISLIRLLVQKGAKLSDIGRQIRLQEHILRANKLDYYSQLCDFRINEGGDQIFLQYQFRLLKFGCNQSYNKGIRNYYSLQSLDLNRKQNFVIIFKISLDLTKVVFTGYKCLEGPRSKKLEEDAEVYLDNSWKSYRKQLQPGSKLSCKKLTAAIEHLSHFFLHERAKHKAKQTKA